MSDRDGPRKTTGNVSDPSGSDLRRLSELDDYQVAHGYPDVRGWTVLTPDGHELGRINDLVVSLDELRVRYLDVDVDDAVRGTTGHGARALVPIGSAELDDAADRVIASGLGSDLMTYPRYDGDDLSPEYEARLRQRLDAGRSTSSAPIGVRTGDASTGAADAADAVRYADAHFDDQKFYAKRRPSAGTPDRPQGEAGSDTQRLTLSEEELHLGKRQVQGGEVEVRKTVDTEHVTQEVSLAHEEVTVERRPITDAGVAATAIIGESAEVRVPVMREEAVVEKKAVVREEIIIRRQPKTEQKTVEADVRRERLDVDRAGTGKAQGEGVPSDPNGARDTTPGGDPGIAPTAR